eukprot:5285356-Karenia_brevis.AAC.1
MYSKTKILGGRFGSNLRPKLSQAGPRRARLHRFLMSGRVLEGPGAKRRAKFAQIGPTWD